MSSSDRDGDHYFTSSPSADSRPGRIRLTARGLDLVLGTDRGVFSPNRIDPGTSLLLERAPDPPPEGRFLDLGCGYGPIACTLATLAPEATVEAVDVNQRALDLCRTNARNLGLANVTVHEPERASGGPYDLIWSNPPIRVGKEALHELLADWLGRLGPGGTAVLVVNRHLGADSLQRWLDARGLPTERIASKRGYRLLRSTAP